MAKASQTSGKLRKNLFQFYHYFDHLLAACHAELLIVSPLLACDPKEDVNYFSTFPEIIIAVAKVNFILHGINTLWLLGL